MTVDERERLAFEYVLGTLSHEERATAVAFVGSDPGFKHLVHLWEGRLEPLADLPLVAPPDRVWTAIEAGIEARRSGTEAVPAPIVLALRRSRSLWRGAALASGALAAGLLLFVAAGDLTPRGGEYVAVVNRGGELPALIVRLDTRNGLVRVRSLAAEVPAERSLELWYVGEGRAPRSLGVIETADQALSAPGEVTRSTLEGGTLAVSLEPRGGSRTGSPTGPVVYSGRLIKE
jgi:anti-sigma-K factor RskA